MKQLEAYKRIIFLKLKDFIDYLEKIARKKRKKKKPAF
jgi:hypothetical protein